MTSSWHLYSVKRHTFLQAYTWGMTFLQGEICLQIIARVEIPDVRVDYTCTQFKNRQKAEIRAVTNRNQVCNVSGIKKIGRLLLILLNTQDHTKPILTKLFRPLFSTMQTTAVLIFWHWFCQITVAIIQLNQLLDIWNLSLHLSDNFRIFLLLLHEGSQG